MRYQKEIINRLAEGLAPVTCESELIQLQRRFNKAYTDVSLFVNDVHAFYQDLLVKRDVVEPDLLAGVQKPQFERDIPAWVEDLEEACMPALIQYLEC